MKAIADKKKPKQKSEIPYRLKSAIDNHTASRSREEIESNEAATEQTQQVAVEVVYRVSQVPPQIQYAIHKHKQKIAKEKQQEQERIYTDHPDAPAPESTEQSPETNSPQEQSRLKAQQEAAHTDSTIPIDSTAPNQPNISGPELCIATKPISQKADHLVEPQPSGSRLQSIRQSGQAIRTTATEKEASVYGQPRDPSAPKQKTAVHT